MADVTDIPIENLFDRERLPTGIGLLVLLVYSPIGVIISVLRVFLGLHAFVISCILPKTNYIRGVVLRCLCTLLGYYITQENADVRHSESERCRVIVANHVSPLDFPAVNLVEPCVLPNVWDIPELLRWMFGYADLGVQLGRDALIQNAKKLCSESEISLLAFPEGAMTSSRKGMLKFSNWPFSLDRPVQPLIISISRPIGFNVSTIVLGSRWWLDILWFMFVPYTHFTLKWLPVLSAEPEESVDQFAARAQRTMCAAAGLVPTRHTSQDAVDYAKRVLLEQQMQDIDNKIESMVEQVKRVLPQVPIAVIREDLRQSRTADTTIANLLEGRVAYIPELVQPLVAKRPSRPIIIKDNNPDSWKAVYMERKRLLIEENRRKYLTKQGLIPSAILKSSINT